MVSNGSSGDPSKKSFETYPVISSVVTFTKSPKMPIRFTESPVFNNFNTGYSPPLPGPEYSSAVWSRTAFGSGIGVLVGMVVGENVSEAVGEIEADSESPALTQLVKSNKMQNNRENILIINFAVPEFLMLFLLGFIWVDI
jgi:hypothetical protein